MSESSKPGATEVKELMRRVLESDASEAFEQFMVRQVALSDMAPRADDAVLDGIEDVSFNRLTSSVLSLSARLAPAAAGFFTTASNAFLNPFASELVPVPETSQENSVVAPGNRLCSCRTCC